MKKLVTVLLACFFSAGIAVSAHATIIYSEDFETTNGGYTHGGGSDEWEWGTTNVGHTAWGTDISSSYNSNSSQWLQSISIDLSYADLTQPLSFSFDYYANFENYFDSIAFDYSLDGGSSWTNYYWANYDSPTWTNWNQDLTGLASSTLDLRWQLNSDYSITGPGLYIDNVSVDGTSTGSNAVPEPASMILFGTGLVGFAVKRRKA